MRPSPFPSSSHTYLKHIFLTAARLQGGFASSPIAFYSRCQMFVTLTYLYRNVFLPFLCNIERQVLVLDDILSALSPRTVT